MRKVFLCLAFVSVFALSTGVASAQKKEPPKSNNLPATAFDCTAQPGNIVADCQFQSGGFTIWTNTGDTSASFVQACGHIAGTNCAHMGPTDYAGLLSQTLATTPGQTYTLSFWVSNFLRPSQFQVFWDANWASPLLHVDNVPDFAYTQFAFSVTATGPSTVLRFTFYNSPSFINLTDVAVF